MKQLVRLSLLSCCVWIAAGARAQHCGGPCEVPRGADPVSADPKYALTMGKERANWRYLFNWIWTENGEKKHRLEKVLGAPPLRDFGYRRMFVSPAGNGFLVTGNAYSREYLEGEEPPLFVFCDPEGKRLVEMPLKRVLTDKERRLGKCPSCDCCTDTLYVFAEDPSLSANGCFVELTAHGTQRRIGFFLPLGLPVRDRAKFEATLARAEWATLAPRQRESREKEIEALVNDLRAARPKVRTKAADTLVTRGFLALDALRKARAESSSKEFRSRAKAIEEKLRPFAGAGWNAMAIDLSLLAALRSDPDEDIAKAVQARLERILPPVKGMKAAACAAWIEKRRTGLKWNPAKGHYEE